MRKSKKMCAGCRNNRYNMGNGFVERAGIDAVVTTDECWGFQSATVVKKKMVSIHQRPPWNQKPTKVLSCFSQSGYVAIDPNQTC